MKKTIMIMYVLSYTIILITAYIGIAELGKLIYFGGIIIGIIMNIISSIVNAQNSEPKCSTHNSE